MSIPRLVRATSSAIWPAVKVSLEIRTAQRKAVAKDPDAFTPAARARAERSWTRVVLEESLWTLAKQGLLCSEEQQNVVEAARAWARSWINADGPPDSMDAQEDQDLYAAIQALASAINPEALDESAVG